MDKRYNIAVIGGGPAGYVAAIRGAQLGAKVVLFEKDTVGGTCLNRGCIPSKVFLKTAEYIRHIGLAPQRGIIMDSSFHVDMPGAVRYKDKVVKTLTGGVASLLKANGVELIKGSACLASANTVECGGQLYESDNIILCGGSEPAIPPIPGIDSRDVLTSTELLSIDKCPERLCIIGGGVIGCELATAFSAFGSRVTIVEMADRLTPMFEKEVSDEVTASLKRAGINVILGEKVLNIKALDSCSVVETGSGELVCDKILAAVGRKPDLFCLGTLAGRIRVENGHVWSDEYLATNIPNIYACGDLNGKMMLTHAAYHMGEIAAENCLGKRVKCNLNRTPNCMYTNPEVAVVGMTEEDALARYGERICIGRFKIGANGRAIAYDERAGYVKVVADSHTGELLGAQIVGYMATELINEAVAIMEGEMTIRQAVSGIVHPHPSFSECFYEACLDALGRAVHLPPRK